MRQIAFTFLLAASVLAAQSASHGPAHTTETTIASVNVPENYVIGSEDVLAISVWKEPDVSRSVPVRPDGQISLPLVGETPARGLTPRELEAKLRERLSAYMANPEVTVIVQEVKSQKFNIMGEIAKPGTYPLNPPMTVLDAIAAAGGFRDFAKTKKIYVLRTSDDGTKTKLPFNYKEVIKGAKLEQNVQLRSHDTIVVP
jgi:polysaccharide export outer membrane protein